MSAIIEASDVACASAAYDLCGADGNGLKSHQRIALVAQLFADHRAKTEAQSIGEISALGFANDDVTTLRAECERLDDESAGDDGAGEEGGE